jgi:hypothetical protein
LRRGPLCDGRAIEENLGTAKFKEPQAKIKSIELKVESFKSVLPWTGAANQDEAFFHEQSLDHSHVGWVNIL